MSPSILRFKQAEFTWTASIQVEDPTQLKHHGLDPSTQKEVKHDIYSSEDEILWKLLNFISKACFLQDTAVKKKNKSMERVFCSVITKKIITA